MKFALRYRHELFEVHEGRHVIRCIQSPSLPPMFTGSITIGLVHIVFRKRIQSHVEPGNSCPRGAEPQRITANPAGGGTISDRPAYAEGINRANENAFDLERMRRNVRDAVFRAPYLGTVLDLQLADYILPYAQLVGKPRLSPNFPSTPSRRWTPPSFEVFRISSTLLELTPRASASSMA